MDVKPEDFEKAYAGGNQLMDILRQAAEQAANAEDSIRPQQTSLSAEDIAQFTI